MRPCLYSVVKNRTPIFAFFLFHSEEKTNTGGSLLGLYLVIALKEVGQVNHTIWNEIDR